MPVSVMTAASIASSHTDHDDLAAIAPTRG
jgi:hypothetical protein